MSFVTRQRGSTLIVSLMILLALTMLALSAMNSGTVNLRIVSNMQAQSRAEFAVTQAIDEFISNIANFTAPPTSNTSISSNGLTVTIAPPVCRDFTIAPGYGASAGAPPENTLWEFVASVTDNDTGATTTIRQGVQILMLSGSCP